jgi:hypothetical protein
MQASPLYAGDVAAASAIAPAATRGDATASNFRPITFNIGAKDNAMFSGPGREKFMNKLREDMAGLFKDILQAASCKKAIRLADIQLWRSEVCKRCWPLPCRRA